MYRINKMSLVCVLPSGTESNPFQNVPEGINTKYKLFHRTLFVEPIQTSEMTVTETKSTTTNKKTKEKYVPIQKK